MAFSPSTYRRYIELLDTDASTQIAVLNDRNGVQNVVNAEFQLLRQGGCGSGSLTLARKFDYTDVEVGQFIRVSHHPGEPWYLGRIETVDWSNPSGIDISMHGMFGLLHDVQIGGYGPYDLRVPHVFGDSDYFVNDPFHNEQSFSTVNTYTDFVNAVYAQYIAPTGIGLDVIEAPDVEVDFRSLKFQGTESIAQVLRSIAIISYGASYGVNASGNFFFRKAPTTLGATYRVGVNADIRRKQDRQQMYNRLTLYGGFVWDNSGGSYRYVRNAYDAASVTQWGQKPVVIYLPYIRNDQDAEKFITGFFSKYAGPRTRYGIETFPDSTLYTPWGGTVKAQDVAGVDLTTDIFDELNVQFNEAPYFTLLTGVEDIQFPDKPEDEAIEEGRGGDGSPLEEPGWTTESPETTTSTTTTTTCDPEIGFCRFAAQENEEEGRHWENIQTACYINEERETADYECNPPEGIPSAQQIEDEIVLMTCCVEKEEQEPCGHCMMQMNFEYEWQVYQNFCGDEECECHEPNYCVEPGQKVRTGCGRGGHHTKICLPCTTTSTTTSTTPDPGTTPGEDFTTHSPECGYCTWLGAPIATCSTNANVNISTYNGCRGVVTGEDDPDGTYTCVCPGLNPLDCGVSVDVPCSVVYTPPPPPPRPSKCGGRCCYVGYANEWQGYNLNTCQWFGTPRTGYTCYCQPPDTAPSDCVVIHTPCYSACIEGECTTTTPDPNYNCTSTTTGDPEEPSCELGECWFEYAGVDSWGLDTEKSNCPEECPCKEPDWNPTPDEVAQRPCGGSDPQGACCVTSGGGGDPFCGGFVTESECSGLGGEWYPGMTCEEAECPDFETTTTTDDPETTTTTDEPETTTTTDEPETTTTTDEPETTTTTTPDPCAGCCIIGGFTYDTDYNAVFQAITEVNTKLGFNGGITPDCQGIGNVCGDGEDSDLGDPPITWQATACWTFGGSPISTATLVLTQDTYDGPTLISSETQTIVFGISPPLNCVDNGTSSSWEIVSGGEGPLILIEEGDVTSTGLICD